MDKIVKSTVVSKTFEAFPEKRKAAATAVSNTDPFKDLPLGPEGRKRAAAAEMHLKQLPNDIDPRHLPPGIAPQVPQQPQVHHASQLTTQPEQPPTLPVVSPGFTTAMTEPEAVALDLPSRYAFYPFKELYVKPFRGLHLSKLSRAREDGSTMHMLEVVSSVLSNGSGDTNLAFRLTVPDFYFVLYWLRMNSFTKSLFIHKTQCSNEQHLVDVAQGKKPRESLIMSEIINRSTLTVDMLDEMPNMELFTLQYPGVSLAVATMQGAVELTEDARFSDPEFRYSAQYAVYLDLGRPSTLNERIAIINDMSADYIETIKDFELAVADYGIKEQVRLTCKGCGASKLDKVHIDAHSFFPVR